MKHSRNLIPDGAFPRSIIMLLTVILGASSTARADDPVYTMTTIVDSHYGAEIIAGEYKQAIEKIAAMDDDVDAFFKNTNLCVAYTKTGKLEAAFLACDAAVEQAASVPADRRSPPYSLFQRSARKNYLAMALANRGVLHAATGDLDLARQDFVEALSVKPKTKVAVVNLARLGEYETKKA